jgi:hypothetical protein
LAILQGPCKQNEDRRGDRKNEIDQLPVELYVWAKEKKKGRKQMKQHNVAQKKKKRMN